MVRQYWPHRHSDDLGDVRRDGQVAICPGCDKVVKGLVAYGVGYWKPLMWPWSRMWRNRLVGGNS